VGGDIEKEDAIVAFRVDGKAMAFASLGRDYACLEAERALEVDDARTMKELTAR